MKKTLFFLFLSLSLVGCKKCGGPHDQGKQTNCPPIGLPISCNDTLLTEFICSDPGDRVAWLQKNGDLLCAKNLYDCIVFLHTIDSVDFKTLAQKHPENKNKIHYYGKEWKEIKNVMDSIKCYHNYVSFDTTANDVKPIKISKFDLKETCYSGSFLQGIETKFKIKGTDSIYFAKAKVPITQNGVTIIVTKIIFKIKKEELITTAFFDISDFPGFLNPNHTSCGL
ncbi:MAG: hypothetical protein ABI426_12290 [Flavobacterium sp.]